MGLLSQHQPHICTLQECNLPNGLVHILRSVVSPLGYQVLPGKDGLCTLVRFGLNAAPIALADADTGFRAQRLALQMGENRVLIRHRHADSASALRRKEYATALEAEASGQHIIDIGDFNECPKSTYVGDGFVLFPSENTYRHNTATDAFVTCIDGAVVSQTLAASGQAVALEALCGVQHRPVLVDIAFQPSFHDRYRWSSSTPIRMGPWDANTSAAFALAMRTSTDEAWRIWQDAAGAAHAGIVKQTSQGAWSAGPRASELNGLWKTLRRQQHDGRRDAASNTLGYISSLIDDANTVRLMQWKQRMLLRGGAAAWVKTRLAEATPPTLPPFGAETFSPAQLARKLATGLATRWNSGIRYIKHRARFSTAFARSPVDQAAFSQELPSPAGLQRPHADLRAFDAAPPYVPPGKWSPEEILANLPNGAPGLDGQDTEWILHLHIDALRALASLLDRADLGHLPTFWRHSRVTLIPKGEDALPGDRRPITIMAVTYRIWAKRHAAALNEWLVTWAPSGLSGGIANHSCPDVLWELQTLLAKARTGHRPPAFVLSMDLEKCFDRLDLPNLERIARKLQLEACLLALGNYRVLSRLLFVDGEPSEVWLEGTDLVGVPQGCPLACFLCNLTSIAWHYAVANADPLAVHFSYLDDRFVVANSWAALERILRATDHLDVALGPQLNNGKCARGAIGPPRRPPAPCPANYRTARIPSKTAFRYLGIDLVLRQFAPKEVAARRIQRFLVRCKIVRLLPRQQRGASTADAVAALWTDGPHAYTQKQIDSAVSAGFTALAGRASDGSLNRRSRAMTHALGPGLHRTHLAVSMAYGAIRQYIRMLLLGRLASNDWHHLWAHRTTLFAGPSAQLRAALHWMSVDWEAPTRLRFGVHVLRFAVPDSILANAGFGPIRYLTHRPAVQQILHRARDFFRLVIVSAEATRRPKDFGGLENGWCEHHNARTHMHAMLLHFGGPSLASAGLWTQLAITRIPFHCHTDICPRCDHAVETTMHRLWDCPHNASFRAKLDAECPGNAFPQGLPACLARCGLLPKNLPRHRLTIDAAISIQRYLLAVNAIATQAQADARKGKPVVLVEATPRCLPIEEVFNVAMPPLKRLKPGGSPRPPLPTGAPRGARAPMPLVMPSQPSATQFVAVEPLVLSCDGSYLAREDASGWGFSVCGTRMPRVYDYCGPTILDPTSEFYVGATQHTNNVGELLALIFAISWLINYPIQCACIIEYDSTYAADTVQRFSRGRANLSLVLRARSLFDEAVQRITWRKVAAHAGHFTNERADHLAKLGANGMFGGRAEILQWSRALRG